MSAFGHGHSVEKYGKFAYDTKLAFRLPVPAMNFTKIVRIVCWRLSLMDMYMYEESVRILKYGSRRSGLNGVLIRESWWKQR